jgi:hypothetical protein
MATYLSRTPSSAGNRRTFTISLWFKRAQVGDRNCLFITDGANDHDRFELTIHQNNYLMVGLNSFNIFETTMLFRDTLSWYHIMFVADSTQGSSANRTKLYINGEQITDFSATNQNSISSNFDFGVNNTNEHRIGAETGGGNGTNGYIADFNLIDGAALTPSSFGETDSTTGEWKPKNISGLTYGTNGVYLEFKNAGALGTDTSGNTNTYTVNNAGTNAQVTDTPSNNFVTMNSLANRFPNSTFTKGNLALAMGSSQSTFNTGTLGLTKGKWYFEMKPTALGSGTDNCLVGIVSRPDSTGTSDSLGDATSVIYRNNGQSKKDGSNATHGASWTTSNVIMVAIDADNNNVYFGTDGQWANGSGSNNQANPTSALAFTSTMVSDGIVFPAFGDLSTNSPEPGGELNFGNPTFTISSGNADAAGHGNFEYAVPSGYYAICTRNLNTYG